MARSRTATSAKTFTFTRIELLKLQVRIALRRTTGISSDSLQSIDRGVDEQWIRTVHVYGIDKSNLCHAQLTLEINWREHNLQISMGRVAISIDEKVWVDNTAVEVDEMVRLFNEYVKAKNLRTKWAIVYRPGLDRDRLNRILGFRRAKKVKWAGKAMSSKNLVPDLPELCVGLRLVE